ncbi:MAG: methylamine dehydrogenase accessory protein MauD [Pseudomonadota bacterium]
MPASLITSNVLLWIVVIVLSLIVIALARQIGVLHERIAPAGALMTGAGPKVGEAAPEVAVRTLSGDTLSIGSAHPQQKSTLLFFLSPTCPVCKTLLPVLRTARRSEKDWLAIVLASDGDKAQQEAFVKREKLDEFPYVLSEQLGMSFEVSKLPYAALIDGSGTLSAKGLVNSREHIESLFEAKAQGVASVQEFLAREKINDPS